ncbi:hypothetical protein ACLK11_14280 [Escherichia coli]
MAGRIPFPSLRSNANGCPAIINLAAILYPFASLASLFLLGLNRLAIKLSGITSLVGGVIGIISGITQLHGGVTLAARLPPLLTLPI